MKRLKVLLADDHTILAEGLAALLKDHFTLVGVAADGRELLEHAKKSRPDVIITDISMPLLNGLDALRSIRKAGLEAKVIILTMHEDATLAIESLNAGAAGFLIKRSACTELIEAINAVAAGRTYFSSGFEDVVRTSLAKTKNNTHTLISSLSPRQREIMQLTAEGKSMKEIAALLNISPRTVESHKYALMQTLGLKSTAELIQWALKSHLV